MNGAATDVKPKLFTPDLVKLCAASFLFQLAFQMVLPVISLYAVELGASESIAGLVIGVFAVSALCARIPLGRYIDTHHRKGLLLVGSALHVLGPLLYLVSSSPSVLIVARLAHGFGLGAWAVASMTMVVDIVPSRRRAEALGYYGFFSLMPITIGPVIGTPIVEYLSYSHAFIIASIIAALPILLVLRIRERFTPRSSAPSRFTDALRNKELMRSSLAIIFIYIAGGAIVTFLPIHAVALGMSVTGVGAFFLAMAMGNIIARGLIGRIADWLKPIYIVVPFFALLSAGIFGMAAGTDIALFALSGLAFGTGQGTLVVTLHSLSVSTVGANLRGTATGIFTSLPEVGILVGSSGLGILVESMGFSAVFTLLAVVVPLGAVAFWAVDRYWPFSAGSAGDGS